MNWDLSRLPIQAMKVYHTMGQQMQAYEQITPIENYRFAKNIKKVYCLGVVQSYCFVLKPGERFKPVPALQFKLTENGNGSYSVSIAASNPSGAANYGELALLLLGI